MGLSILVNKCNVRKGATGFRPLSGKWGYRSWTVEVAWYDSPEFPSPLGEMGLSIGRVTRLEELRAQGCFRPLSGKWGYRFDEQLRHRL